MRLAVSLTADVIIRGLRGLAHALAEDAEQDYARGRRRRPEPDGRKEPEAQPGETRDDRRRR